MSTFEYFFKLERLVVLNECNFYYLIHFVLSENLFYSYIWWKILVIFEFKVGFPCDLRKSKNHYFQVKYITKIKITYLVNYFLIEIKQICN